MVSLIVRDEVAGGDDTPGLTLSFLDERITARALIRARVYQEVAEFNAAQSPLFRGLVQPRDSDLTHRGFRLRAPRALDWEKQYARALRAFQTNGFILLVGDRQVESLDVEIDVRHDTSVTFLKLMPLVGG